MSKKLFKAKWNRNSSIINIAHKEISSKGIKVLLIDVDGTIVPGRNTKVDAYVKAWIKEASNYFKLHLVSNNPSRKRIKNIADQLDLSFTYKAGKPRIYALRKYISEINVNINEVAIIGDRIFTDILAGNRLGLYTILVKPIKPIGEQNHTFLVQMIESKVVKILEVFQK